MESNRKKILKFTIIGLAFLIVILINNNIYAAEKLKPELIKLEKTSYEYTGNQIKPKVTVEFPGYFWNKTLKKNIDYTVTYSNNIKISPTHYYNPAQVIIKGKGNYTGTVIKDFTIKPIDINKFNIYLPKNEYTYDSFAKKPEVRVTNKQTGVWLGTRHYTITYRDNIDPGVNRGKVIVTGTGIYGGSKILKFTIKQRPISSAIIELDKNIFEYDGTAKKPQIKNIKILAPTGYIKVAARHYTITSYKNNIDPKGNNKGKVVIKGQANFTGTTEVSFTINKRKMSTAIVELEENTFTYDGTAKKPQIKSVKIETDAGKLVNVNKKYYTVSYAKNIDPGNKRGEVIITGKDKFTGTKKVNFTINKRDINTAEIQLLQTSFTYDSLAKKPSISSIKIRNAAGRSVSVSSNNYTVSYKDNINSGTASAIITGRDKFTGTKTVKFRIEKCPITDCSITVSDEYYEGKALEPQVDIEIKGIRLAEKYYSLYCYNNTNVGTASVIIMGEGNFCNTVTKNFRIKTLPTTASAKNQTGTGYTKTATVGNRTYKIYNQGAFSSKIVQEGCSITSEAIVLSGYGKNKTPQNISDDIGESFPRDLKQIAGDMTRYGVPSTYESRTGSKIKEAQSESVRKETKRIIKNNLVQGKPVIMLVHQGKDNAYTSDAHYIVLIGFDKNGNPAIADPNGGQYRCKHSLETLIKEYMYYNSTAGERGYVLIK